MRNAFYGGLPGVFTSGLIWMAAGLVAWMSSPGTSLLVFFLGGMLIYPLGMVLARALGRSGKPDPQNPLTGLALETTGVLFVGLFIAWVVYQLQPAWFYPIMLLIIGVRYLAFRTLYGDRIYWLLGALLMAAGIIFLVQSTPFFLPALAGGSIELVVVLFVIVGGRGSRLKP